MRIFIALVFISASAPAALALNWEGHDEWMTQMPAALEYDHAHPQAAAKWKLKPCAEPQNAYDQVPLPGRNCADPGHAPKKKPDRVR